MKYDIEKISNKIKNKKMTKKIIKYIILVTLIILFIINLILSFEENTHILGLYMFNIVSESMEPTFNKDDLVVVRKCSGKELQKGDIITSIDNKQINNMIELRKYIYSKSPGDTISINISRGYITQSFKIILK